MVTATDPTGNVSPPTTITIDSTPPTPPAVDPSDGSAVTGAAEPGSNVTVTNPDGTVACTATADATTGAFSCEPSPTPATGDQLTVIATDPAGNPSTPTTITVTDDTPPAPPVVNPSDGTTVTGTAEPDSTVHVTDPDGNILCTTTAASDGTFTCTPDTPIPPGTAISVTSADPSGNVSNPAVETTTSRHLAIGVTVPVVHRGEIQESTGTGFLPGESVSATMFSTPLDVGVAPANETGVVTFTWTIPADTPLGMHTIVLTGAQSGAVSATFEVIDEVGGLAFTGTDIANLIFELPVLAIGLGVLLLGIRRRRNGEVA
jgi:hypothetical protein